MDIPGNGTGQIIASSSTYIHVQGAYGARTGAVSSAADGRPDGDVIKQKVPRGHCHAAKLSRHTQWAMGSVPAKFGCMAMAPWYLFFDNVTVWAAVGGPPTAPVGAP